MGEPSAKIGERVKRAREPQHERFVGAGWSAIAIRVQVKLGGSA